MTEAAVDDRCFDDPEEDEGEPCAWCGGTGLTVEGWTCEVCDGEGAFFF